MTLTPSDVERLRALLAALADSPKGKLTRAYTDYIDALSPELVAHLLDAHELLRAVAAFEPTDLLHSDERGLRCGEAWQRARAIFNTEEG